jgi:alpha-tubulin suppressor-like RCC1 family protein
VNAVYCWGSNSQGEYGAGGTPSAIPIDVTVPDLSEIGSGTGSHSCGILADLSATCWGRSGFGQLGGATLGGTPLQTVTGGISWSQISTGRLSSCGVSTTGVAYCWGSNQSGEIGSVTIGITTGGASGSPVQVDGGLTWKSVTVGWQHACGIDSNNDAYCWGDNRLGSVGAGTAEQQYRSPVMVTGGHKWTQLSAGSNYTCGITTTRQAYCWGLNDGGQLGDGTTTTRLAPTAVSNAGVTFTVIAASTGQSSGGTAQLGNGVTCALAESGAPYCWGYNGFGALGAGGTTNSSVPVPVSGGLVLNGLSVGSDSACGMRGDAIWCWGWNDLGQLGNGAQFNTHSPQTVSGGFTYANIAKPLGDVCGVVTSGSPSAVVCWGTDVTSANFGGFNAAPATLAAAETFTTVATGAGNHACGLTSTNEAYCWGFNGSGQFGNGSTSTVASSPQLVAGGHAFAAITVGGSHTCALTAAGAAYCWGFNGSGQLGDGTITAATTLTPAAVVGGHVFQAITAASSHTCALTTDNAAYCWGLNSTGQLGNASTTASGTPVLVSGGPFTALSAGSANTCGIRDTQVVQCWGQNTFGVNGNNIGNGNQTTPGALAGGFAATPFSAISVGVQSACGISAGAAYCWGQNSFGQAGQPTTSPNFLTPAPVTGGLTLDRIAAGLNTTCALTPGGTAYCWGANTTGQLGNGAAAVTLPGRVTGF